MKFLNRWFLGLFCAFMASMACAENISMPLQKIAIHPMRSAPATALSLNHATLSAQILAKVDAIKVGVSQKVAKGDILLQLDCTDYQLALETAKVALKIADARLKLASSQKNRSEQLLNKQLTSQEAADTTQTEAVARKGELEQAKLALRKAEIEVQRCLVKAPFDGIVTERVVSVGQLAAVGTPLITLMETDSIELSAQVKPSDLDQLQHAQEMYFETQKRFPVKLLRMGGIVNSQTRSQEIRLSFHEESPPPGTAGKLVWSDGRNYVSADFVVKRKGSWGVFVNRKGVAEFVPLLNVIPGRPTLTALPGDTQIITKKLGQLESGQKLNDL